MMGNAGRQALLRLAVQIQGKTQARLAAVRSGPDWLAVDPTVACQGWRRAQRSQVACLPPAVVVPGLALGLPSWFSSFRRPTAEP